jgi:hypothetical protein
MAEAVRIMLNEAIRLERSRVIEAEPYQRSKRCRGYANGFKPKNSGSDSLGKRRQLTAEAKKTANCMELGI